MRPRRIPNKAFKAVYKTATNQVTQPNPPIINENKPPATTSQPTLPNPLSMPPRLRGSLPLGLLRPLDSGGVFFCPSCATWRRILSAHGNGVLPRRAAHASYRQLATSTVVSAGRNVPSRFKELYEALDRVGKTATGQVNLSRLQLALRGLESETPVIRVAGMSS